MRESNLITETITSILSTFRPPSPMTVSEWANERRILSPETCVEPGKFYISRVPYMKGIMDAFSDPSVETVVFMSAVQVGKTTICENVIGYYIDQDPSPILIVQPKVDMAEEFSKDRLMPMLRDTHCLRGKVKDASIKSSGNTIYHKTFPGGNLSIISANSPASLAARPIRILLCDEVDKYPISAGVEGDPIDLALKRTTTFWNRKIGIFSTPTIKGLSRIELAYESSDKRRYYVPCPHCNYYQVLLWGQLKWEKENSKIIWYECANCRGKILDRDKPKMLSRGEWRAEGKFENIAGFWLNELYSPWVTFRNIQLRFFQAKKSPETLKVFTNTSLAETWEEGGEIIDDGTLFGRRERYGPIVPMDAAVLTAGVDVQDDRIEIEVIAWGKGEESWSMDWKAFHGNTEKLDVWNQLDEYLNKLWEHESGAKLKIAATCIDSGAHTKMVYSFVKPRQLQRVFAIKGSNQPGMPLVGRPTISNIARVKLFPIGTDTAKDTLFARLKIEDFGPGYMHFPYYYEEEYFKQLTAEKVVTKFHKGFPKREYVKIRARNDVIDERVYAMAALVILNPNIEKILTALKMERKKADNITSPQTQPQMMRQRLPFVKRRIKSGWIKNF